MIRLSMTADSPLIYQRGVGLPQIILRPGIGGIKDIKPIGLHGANLQRLADIILYEPVPVVLINPGAVRHLERCCPYSRHQSQPMNLVFQAGHPVRKERRVGSGVFPPGILVAFINVKDQVCRAGRRT